MPEEDNLKLQSQIENLESSLQDLRFIVAKKLGSGSNNIRGSSIESTNFTVGKQGWKFSPEGNLLISSLTWNKLTGISSFASIDGFSQKGTGVSTYTPYFLGTLIRTAAANGDFGILYSNPSVNGNGTPASAFLNPVMQVTCRVSDNAFAEGFIGLFVGTGWPLANAAGVEYIGFHLKDSQGYAVHRQTGQSTVSTSLALGIGISVFHTYQFEVSATSAAVKEIKFYLDGKLKAIHTTTLPTGLEDADIAFGVKNWNNGGAQDLNLINMFYAQDFNWA